MKTITIAKIEELAPVINHILSKYPESKIEYAVNKFIKQSNKVTELFSADSADLRIDLALEENGKLLKDDKGGFVYSKENAKLLEAGLRELKNKEYPFTPCFTKEVPEKLSEIIKEDIAGYLIDPTI